LRQLSSSPGKDLDQAERPNRRRSACQSQQHRTARVRLGYSKHDRRREHAPEARAGGPHDPPPREDKLSDRQQRTRK
jgi:hypothetical protein